MCSKLLDPSSRKPLLEIVETHLFTPHLPQLVEKGFKVRYWYMFIVCKLLFLFLLVVNSCTETSILPHVVKATLLYS